MIENLKDFCRLFHSTTFIPVTLKSGQPETVSSFPLSMERLDISPAKLTAMLRFTDSPDYIISDSFGYLGYIKVKDSEDYIVVGPVYSTPMSDTTIRDFMHEWSVPSDYKDEITTFLQNTPQISFRQFLNTLAYLHLCINDIVIDVRDHFRLTGEPSQEISKLHSDLIFERKEQQSFHNTYHFEREMMKCIQEGNAAKLKQLLSVEDTLSPGIVADTTLRQEKNIFVVTLTLTTRSAVAGGLDIEQAYSLCDVYIQECEKLHDVRSISVLIETALLDFTERVAANKIPTDMSPEVFECVQFIQRNTHEPIQVGDVVDHVKRSRSYITLKFKEELGFDISSFIMRCKLEEAKSLLTYSTKSLSEISTYLCFSSQGYFQNVFKKKFGMTPLQYRKTHGR